VLYQSNRIDCAVSKQQQSFKPAGIGLNICATIPITFEVLTDLVKFHNNSLSPTDPLSLTFRLS